MLTVDLIDIPRIESVDTDNGRFYTTPDGNKYQSVTTFLGKFSDKSWLDDWKNRVGEEKANKVSTQAKKRGTAVHNILEQYLLNNPKYAFKQMPNNMVMARSIINVLDDHIDVVKGIEVVLWSDSMKIAGRADLYAIYNGKESIVDFKTAKNNKNEEDIQDYFLQCTIYARMLEEMFNIQVPQIVVIIGVDNEPAQTFVKDKSEYLPTLNKLLSYE